MHNLSIIIISGLSGSGKSTALDAFEDAGFYCVDNLPVMLLPKFLEMPVETSSGIRGLAFVMDLREKDFLSRSSNIFAQLRKKGYYLTILFLEADQDVLIQRYSQTRRHHPLAEDKGLLHGIKTEQKRLKDLRKASDRIIDTSKYNIHDLKALILKTARQSDKHAPMRIHIMSFGYKHGIPHDSDIIMDVRFLPNPYFVKELKPLDGRSKKVNTYVLQNETGKNFIKKFLDLIDFLVPQYEKEQKAYLSISIGCTGGRHRSVAVALLIYEHISKLKKQIEVTHRDILQE